MSVIRRIGGAGWLAGVVLVGGCSMGGNPMQPTVASALNVSNDDRTASRGGGGTTPPAPSPSTTPLVVSTTALPGGNIGTSYTTFVTSSGGQGTPHTFAIVAGQLPPGLSMASSYGVQSTSITGKPTTVGAWTFTVQVRDQTGHTATRSLSITINGATPVVITNQSDTLAPGTVGAAYALNLFANGGVQPYRWVVSNGQLPPGIGLSSNRLSGTPTIAGTFTFTASVTDSAGAQASRTFSITVSQ